MKKVLAIFLSVFLIFSLTACGAQSKASASPASPQQATAESPAPSWSMADMAQSEEKGGFVDVAGGSPEGNKLKDDRKIIQNTEISMETREFDSALEKINAMIDRLGGYVEDSHMSGVSLYSSGVNSRNAYITARIPADKLSGASDELATIGNILSKNVGTEDITDVYYDVDARLRMLKIQEERYLELLKKADKMEDILTLERALTEVRYEIESLTSQQNRFDKQVSFSYLRIELREVGDYSVVRNQPLSFGQRISNSFKDSLLFISRSVQNLVVYLVAVLPVLIVYGAAIGLIAWVIIIIVKRFGKNKPKEAPPQNKSKDEN